jgi:uncharacterized protein (TIGR02246 family)
MMTTARWLGTALMIMTLESGTAAAADDVRAAVDAGNAAFKAAFLKGDANAVADLYTEDGEVIAPGAPLARGRPAISGAWQKAMDSGVKDLTLATEKVESAGDLAVETGKVTLVAKDGSASHARYLVVWKRTDGTWQLHRDIWNVE